MHIIKRVSIALILSSNKRGTFKSTSKYIS
nr:hypothetical protein SEWZTGNK_SEWZTGNK_CDS_0005 [Microvirus sp.]